MQEVFEKIINKLEILKQQRIATVALHNSYESDHTAMIEFNILKDITDWIGKVAEEYNNGWNLVSENNLPRENEDVLAVIERVDGNVVVLDITFYKYLLDTPELTIKYWQPKPKLPSEYQKKGELI